MHCFQNCFQKQVPTQTCTLLSGNIWDMLKHTFPGLHSHAHILGMRLAHDTGMWSLDAVSESSDMHSQTWTAFILYIPGIWKGTDGGKPWNILPKAINFAYLKNLDGEKAWEQDYLKVCKNLTGRGGRGISQTTLYPSDLCFTKAPSSLLFFAPQT